MHTKKLAKPFCCYKIKLYRLYKQQKGTTILNLTKRVTIAFAVVIILCVFAQKVDASDDFQTINIYYYDLSADKDIFVGEPIDVYGSFTDEQIAFMIFSNLFEPSGKDALPFISEGTKLLSVKIYKEHLIIDVSRQITDYGGGTAFEQALVNTLVQNARQLSGISTVSLLIEGKPEYLPEGTGVFELKIN